MTADRKPATAVFYVPPVFFKSYSAIGSNEDINATNGAFIIYRL
jgi:hypothetical protein